MTLVADAPTTIDQGLAELLADVIGLLATHPAGATVTPIIRLADRTDPAPGVVLVEQPTDTGGIRLAPRPIDALTADDVLHHATVLDPVDTAFTAAAGARCEHTYATHFRAGLAAHAYENDGDGGLLA